MVSTPHIVDVLIAERAPRLVASRFWPVLKPCLNVLLGRGAAARMADAIGPMDGRAALAWMSRLLRLDVQVEGLAHVPEVGACVIVANHPTGIADGIAMWDALLPRRPDLTFYANADAHRVSPGLIDVLVPVEWELHKRTREKTRETLRQTVLVMEAGRPLVVFPAGRLARVVQGRLVDPDWMGSAITIARKQGVPVVPAFLTGPFSAWFHGFDRFSGELRDITLFHELLNKRGKRFTVRLGPPIPPEQLVGDSDAVTRAVKAHVEQVLPSDPLARFAGVAP
jgi:putative hemolysin